MKNNLIRSVLFIGALSIAAAGNAAPGDVKGIRGIFQNIIPSGTTLGISATSLDVSTTGTAINTAGTGVFGTVSASNLNGTSLTVAGTTAVTSDISTSLISANTDNWSPTGINGASVVQISTDASRNLTGIVGGFDGRLMSLVNTGSNNVVLKNNTTSTAANRFLTPSADDVTLTPNAALLLQYDATASRWRIIGAPASGTGATVEVFDVSGTWNKPTSKSPSTPVKVQAWGGGGSGANTSTGTPRSGGGGGGGYKEWNGTLSSLGNTETVTVGVGGITTPGNPENGYNGSSSSFGSLITAYGGTGGMGKNDGSNVDGGAGGGFNATATRGNYINDTGGQGYGGRVDPFGVTTPSASTVALSAGGGGAYDNGSNQTGGYSLYGGGGGGVRSGAGGTSLFGGAGGAGGQPGVAPGGGGGARFGSGSNNGANGRVTVTVY